jgi:MtN3 and saliva related transmembrane protein
MNDIAVTILGFAAAFGTTAAWLPQVKQTWQTRSAEDFSWSYLALFSTGVALWMIYGILRKDPAVVVANAVTLLLVIVMSVVKMREQRK